MSDQNSQPIFQIQRVYLKGLSLEQPNSPAIFLEQESPSIEVAVSTIAEKQDEDDRHQNHPFSHVVEDGVERVMEKIGPIQHGYDLHALGQDMIIQFLNLLMNRIQCGLRVRTLA